MKIRGNETRDYLEDKGFDTQELYDLGYIARYEDKNSGISVCDSFGEKLNEEIYFDKNGLMQIRKIKDENSL